MDKHSLDAAFPIVTVNFQLKNHHCSAYDDCIKFVNSNLSPYIGKEKLIEMRNAWINLENLTFEKYMENVKKVENGSSLRKARKAEKLGYICKPFARGLFIPDIVEINHSKKVRSGGVMQGAYLRTIEEMGGAPTTFVDYQFQGCPNHYAIYWGVFIPIQGYQQGDVVTNEKLIAYAFLRRIGDSIFYSQLIGHGDYLSHGIMYRLHFAIMEWICSKNHSSTEGLSNITYGDYFDGGEGRILWRKKTCFEPAYLINLD